jgi:hypothetical protein
VLHNKPVGCGASGAYALGPNDDEEEEERQCVKLYSFWEKFRHTYTAHRTDTCMDLSEFILVYI